MKTHYKRVLLGEMATTRSPGDTYTCEQIGETEWCCQEASASEMLDFDSFGGEPHMLVTSTRSEWGDSRTMTEPINFCPFCGVPVESVEDEVVSLVKKVTTSTVTRWEHEPA